MTPFEETAIGGQGGRDLRIDKLVPTYEYTFGGPVMKDRLWFFVAGRLQKQESGRNTAITSIPYTFIQDNKRFEYKGTYSVDSNNRFVAAYTKSYRTEENYTFNQNRRWTWPAWAPRAARGSASRSTTRVSSPRSSSSRAASRSAS